jgi:hypothetical protein
MKQALIIGDSQAQACGGALSIRLKSDGYNVVGVFAKPGAGSNGVLNQANLAKSKCDSPDLIVVFSGSVENNISAGVGIPLLFPDAKIIWYGSSPATKILNITLAKKVFGQKVDGDDYWFSISESKERESRNKTLKQFFANTKVNYVDYRDLTFTNDVLQSSGITFPDLQDGIHITPGVAKEMFNAKNFPPQTQSLVSDSLFGVKKSVLVVSGIAALATIYLLYRLSKGKY